MLEVKLMITIPVFWAGHYGLHGELKHIELIMIMLKKNIDVQLKMVMV